jgi:hypothetical protein
MHGAGIRQDCEDISIHINTASMSEWDISKHGVEISCDTQSMKVNIATSHLVYSIYKTSLLGT